MSYIFINYITEYVIKMSVTKILKVCRKVTVIVGGKIAQSIKYITQS